LHNTGPDKRCFRRINPLRGVRILAFDIGDHCNEVMNALGAAETVFDQLNFQVNGSAKHECISGTVIFLGQKMALTVSKLKPTALVFM